MSHVIVYSVVLLGCIILYGTHFLFCPCCVAITLWVLENIFPGKLCLEENIIKATRLFYCLCSGWSYTAINNTHFLFLDIKISIKSCLVA